jgi:hypothetical protein
MVVVAEMAMAEHSCNVGGNVGSGSDPSDGGRDGSGVRQM